MCYQRSLTEQAKDLSPHQWDEIQKLIDQCETTVEVEMLESIMIDKFHEEEAINGDL